MTRHFHPLPQVLEQLLTEASSDEELRRELLQGDRVAAAEKRGHQLTESERAILLAAPEEQLRAVIKGITQGVRVQQPVAMPAGIQPDLPCEGIRPGLIKGTRPGRLLLGAAVTTAALGGAAYYTCQTMAPTGSRPDLPPSHRPAVTKPEEPTAPDAGVDLGEKKTESVDD